MKKIVSITVVILLLTTMVLPGALAQGGGNMGGGGSPGRGMGQNSSGQNPPSNGMGGNQQGGSANGENSMNGESENGPNAPGDQNGPMGAGDPSQGSPDGNGLDTDAVEQAIGEVTDTDTAASLTALLAAYQTAAAGDDADATRTAQKALLDALQAADVKLADNRGDGSMNGMGVDADKIAEAIAAVSDSDTAATLRSLLVAYQTAAAGDDADATQTALKALLDGLADADVRVEETSDPQGGFAMGDRYGRFLETKQISEAINALGDTDTATSLSSLLSAYEEAAAGDDEDATQTALQALLDAMKTADLTVAGGSDQGNKRDDRQLFNLESGKYLDTDKVAEAIATVSDADAAATLTTLLTAYEDAAAGTDDTATQTAFKALMDAMADAGLKIEITQ